MVAQKFPVFLVKEEVYTIRAWSFVRFKEEHNFLISDIEGLAFMRGCELGMIEPWLEGVFLHD